MRIDTPRLISNYSLCITGPASTRTHDMSFSGSGRAQALSVATEMPKTTQKPHLNERAEMTYFGMSNESHNVSTSEP